VIGFTPEQVNAMTFWELQCAVKGWMKANGATPKTMAPSDEEFEAAIMRH